MTQLTSAQLQLLQDAYPSRAEVESNTIIDSSIIRMLPPGVRQLTTPFTFAPGEVVFNENDPGDAMYVIRSGRAAIVRGTFDAPIILGFRGAGEFVGEMALIEDLPRSATVIALDELRLLRISREDFTELLDESTSIDRNLLRKLSARLRAADDERTAILTAQQELAAQVTALQSENLQLLEAQRLQQEAVDLIVHDLRNPLHVIGNALGVLDMTLPDEALRANQELFTLLTNNVDRMSRLVDSILDASRIEAGQVQLQIAPTDLEQLIQLAVQRVRYSLTRHSLLIKVNCPPDLPEINLDADMIDRVLGNLLDNAIKFTPTHGQISIRAEIVGDLVQIGLSDTGPGVPLAQRERAFERFVQVNQSAGRTRGFGLGLRFCRLAVEAHGGQIWIEDGEGGTGSKFAFTLPLD